MEGRPLDEEELVEQARGGDARAYEVLVRRYQDLAFRTAYVIAGGSADAEDAAQEGFVKAWYALPRFRAGSPFRPWLLAIVANEARNRRRSGRRQDDLALRVAEDRPSGDAAPSPEAAALATEQRRLLLAAMGRLRAGGAAVVMATHDLGLAHLACDEVCLLNRHQIGFGPIGTTLTPELLGATYGGQALQLRGDGVIVARP